MPATISISAAGAKTGSEGYLLVDLPDISAKPDKPAEKLELVFELDDHGQRYLASNFPALPKPVVVVSVYIEEMNSTLNNEQVVVVMALPPAVSHEGVTRLSARFFAPKGAGVAYVRKHFAGAMIKHLPLGEKRHWVTVAA